MTPKITTLPLDQIKEDERLQVRSQRSIPKKQREVIQERLENEVEEFKRVLDAGASLDPIDVFRHEGRYLIKDGHHRLRAYKEFLGFEGSLNDTDKCDYPIPVRIHEGDLSFHLKDSLTINTRHGVGLEKQERTQRALFTLVHTPQSEWKPVKELETELRLSESQIEKIRRAARTLMKEANIGEPFDPAEIARKVANWVSEEKSKHARVDGAHTVDTDEQGYPSVNYINDRKLRPPVSDSARVKRRLFSYLDDAAMMYPEELRETFQAINKKHKLKMRFRRDWRPPELFGDNEEDDYDEDDYGDNPDF